MTKNTFFKKALILTIICTMVSSTSTAFGATKSITDIKGNWAEKQIKNWIDKGLTNGYKDGTFKPNNTITRAEFIALINRSFGFKEKAEINFSDAKASDWYYEDVARAVKAGYTSGYTDPQNVQTIAANKKITRQEAAVMIGRLLKLEDDPSGASFNDSNEFAEWSINVIGAVATTQIMKGYEDSTFKPLKPITRAEAVVSLDRAVTFKDATFGVSGLFGPDTGSKTIDSDVTINAAGVTLQNMIINGDLLISDKIGEGDATLKNVIVKGTTTISGGGVSSVHLNNASLDSVIVNKATGPVRIVAEGSSRISSTVVQSSVALEEDGSLKGAGFQTVKLEGTGADSTVSLKGVFEKLAVSGSKIAVSIPSGTVQIMDVSDQASSSTLNISANVIIASLVLNSPVNVTGQGTIQSANISDAAVNSIFEKPPTVRKDINGAVVKPLAPPAFVSVIATNTGNNVGIGAGDTIVITFDQNTNKPAITAANLNLWFKLSSGHSFGTSLINSDINWNSTGNILTVSLSNVTGTTFAIGDTVSVQAAAGLKNSAGSTAASTATSLASTGSFTSSPVISSVTAANTGNNIDKGIGDSVSITFNQNTNRPQIKAANLNAWLTLSNGHSFGTALVDNNISWNPAGNILTITFSNITGNTFAIGDTVTVALAANIKDTQLGAPASTSVSPASVGSFTTFLEVKTAVANNLGKNVGLGVGDTLVLTFASSTNHPVITPANFKVWFAILNGHSFGTNANNVRLTWSSTGDVLTITFLDVTGATFSVGDMIVIQPEANIRDAQLKLPINYIMTPAITGSFNDAPKILSVVASNTGNNAGLGIGDSVAITFDQNTNMAYIPGSTINTLLRLSSGHSFGTNVANSDIIWNSTGNVLTITFSSITGTTFAVGDTITVNKTAAITSALNSTLESTAVSPNSTGNFSPIPATPTVVSVVAVGTGKARDLDVGDSLIITFNQNTNRPAIPYSSLNGWFELNNAAHQFGPSTITWTSPTELTIKFTSLRTDSDRFIALGDTIKISASANIRDATGVSEAYSGTAMPIAGSFSASPIIEKVEAKDEGSIAGLSMGDSVWLTFDMPMRTDDISKEQINEWFAVKNANGVIHSFGTDTSMYWEDARTLVISFNDVTKVTFVKGDTVQPTANAKLYDETGDLKVSTTPSPAASGGFTWAPLILYYSLENTYDEISGDGVTVTIVFDQKTNTTKAIKDTNSLLKGIGFKDSSSPSTIRKLGQVVSSSVLWNAEGDTLTFHTGMNNNSTWTFIDGDTLFIKKEINLKDVSETTAPSTASYPY
jgi:uncharacterized protein YfiM (DUF2279 family)